MKPTASFEQTIWDYYAASGRHDLPWRLPRPDGTFDPYHITVSEIMLQQTQVGRVIPKYEAFLTAFPAIQDVASAPLAEVLTLWSGLGYNRRAKFLWQMAGAVVTNHGGELPRGRAELVSLPGIGPNTAGAMMAYAYNEPVTFIETNIRSVFIHHFFTGQEKVSDAELLPIIEETLPAGRAREWYWALMDYGTHLKQTVGNASRASSTYAKQSTFKGSRRQIRGHILRLLTDSPQMLADLILAISDERLLAVLEDLVQEGFIEQDGLVYHLRML